MRKMQVGRATRQNLVQAEGRAALLCNESCLMGREESISYVNTLEAVPVKNRDVTSDVESDG